MRDRPLFSVVHRGMESSAREKDADGLTERTQIPRLGLLYRTSVVGKMEETIDVRGVAAGRRSILRTGQGTRRGLILPRFPVPIRSTSKAGARTHRSATFRDLRAKVMAPNTRFESAIPHQAARSLSCRIGFSSSRGTGGTVRAMREIRRIAHGSARAIENLRRMWLPLVPNLYRRERLLQEL